MGDTRGLEEQRPRSCADNEHHGQRRDLAHHLSANLAFNMSLLIKQTTSPSLASPDRSMWEASRCSSMPSNTNTNLSTATPLPDARISSSSTTNALICSHLPLPYRCHSSPSPKACKISSKIVVNRCLPVTHSEQRMIAWGTASSDKTARVRVVLHVAEMPWTTTVGGLGTCGCVGNQHCLRRAARFKQKQQLNGRVTLRRAANWRDWSSLQGHF